MERLRV
jgi:hypothetical protein